MLNLKSVAVDKDGAITTSYAAVHVQPGGRGTHLELDLSVRQDPRFGFIQARALLEPRLEGKTTDEILDKLADWAERLAIALKHRGVGAMLVPVFNAPMRPESPDSAQADESQ
jgi:hypothetical protein